MVQRARHRDSHKENHRLMPEIGWPPRKRSKTDLLNDLWVISHWNLLKNTETETIEWLNESVSCFHISMIVCSLDKRWLERNLCKMYQILIKEIMSKLYSTRAGKLRLVTCQITCYLWGRRRNSHPKLKTKSNWLELLLEAGQAFWV